MSSELSYEASDEASENELLDRSLSVWRGWNAIEWEDFTPIALDIHTACSIGHFDWVRSIILKNEDIALDRKNHGGWTPLMYACYIGHDNIVNLLINAGCSMNMKNPRGHTPLMLAASCGNETVARTLVRTGAQLEVVDNHGWTALFHATYAGHQNFAKFLLDAGSNMNARDPSTGITPFMVAAAEGHEIIVQLFLQNGVNVHAKAFNGDVARSLALMNGYIKVVSLIDNHVLPAINLRSEPGLDLYLSSSDDARRRKQHPSRNMQLKSQGPSIRDGPEAIARMIDRTRNTDTVVYPNSLVPKGYVSFPAAGEDKEEPKLSYRDVTSPINPEDYKDSSGSRDFEDFNDDSNAFTKTGAITIKSSSSSSGGLIAALGLSREGSIDSDDLQTSSSQDAHEGKKNKSDSNDFTDSSSPHPEDENLKPADKDDQFSRISLPAVKDRHMSPSTSKTDDDESPSDEKLGMVQKQTQDKQGFLLKDYFPDASFTVGMSEPPVNETQIGTKYSDPRTYSAQVSEKGPEEFLPQENMTHNEIVNRFLKNLTVEDSGASSDQGNAHENYWTKGADSVKAVSSSQYPHLSTAVDSSSSIHTAGALTSDAQVSLPSNFNEYLKLKSIGPGNLSNSNGNKTSSGAKASYEGVLDPHVSKTEKSPGSSVLDINAAETQGQFLPGSNHALLPKDNLSQASGHLRTHHPQLNHHHPLHNRHHHTALPLLQDNHGNMRNIQVPPSHQTMQNDSNQILHNLPQQYFYSDIETASQIFRPPSSVTNQHSSSTAIGVSHKPMDYSSQVPPSSSPASQHNPILDTNLSNIQNPLTSLPPSQINQAYVSYPSTTANQYVTSPSSNKETELGSKPQGYGALGPSSLFQSPQIPPNASASPYQKQPPTNPHQLKQGQGSSTPTPQTDVIVPGYPISHPMSKPIGWLDDGEKNYKGPADLSEMLTQLGLTKYLEKFEEQDVDLQVFLSLTDNDLKELGIKLFGPRKKMTNAIARWHSNAPLANNSLEQAYADKLEGEMQEMAIQLNQAYENEEHLKAQVLQEQQLRSVTESCLMEERASWEQARTLLHDTKGRMRLMGEQISRLRHHQKDLKKQMELLLRRQETENVTTSSKTKNSQLEENTNFRGTEKSETVVSGCQVINDNSAVQGETNKETKEKEGDSHSIISGTAGGPEVMKKSEKCLKEMQQTLSSLVLSADHILNSTHNISNLEKDINSNR